MKQLLKQDPIAMGMLGKQIIQEQEYRPLTYVLTAEEEDQKIYYNLLTHEMVAINFSELDLSETRNYFIENWYLVPKEHDDQQLVDECRAVLTLMDSFPKKIHSFHIFTTLDCNARCFYCFEKRIPGSNMTLETAARVIEYIQEQADGHPINIVWFGGEPLFNYPVIDLITRTLRERELDFESEMISNGLLFDKALIEKANNVWNLKSVQITLDGTREVYTRVKAYVTDVADPFERVIQNIKSLIGSGMEVRIRLNVGSHNYKDMQSLVDFLCKEFKRDDKLFINATALFEVINYSDKKKKFLYDIIDELNRKLKNFFVRKNNNELVGTIVNKYCMASGREAVTILPDGKVGICPNVTNDALLGDIYTKEIDVKMREDFGRRFYREDKCRNCPMYPNCYVVNGCPNKNNREGCDPVKVQRQMARIRKKMKAKCRLDTTANEVGTA